MSCSARVVSATCDRRPPVPRAPLEPAASTSSPAAPPRQRLGDESWPSKRSPLIATKKSPGCDRPRVDRRCGRSRGAGSPATTCPPVAAAISAAVNDSGATRYDTRERDAAPRQRRPRHVDVVERQHPVRRSPGTSRVPCRRRARGRRGAASWIARSIACLRSTIARYGVDLGPRPGRCGVRSAGITMPRLISSMMRSGSSERGLSEVMTTRSLSRAATAPISGRLVRSRSPPQPNTVITRPGASGRAVSSRFFRASSVWA